MRQSEKTVSPMSNEGRNSYVIEHITDALSNGHTVEQIGED